MALTPEQLKDLADSLLPDLKNYLDITWTDPQTDKKLEGILQRGITYINRTAGEDLEYEEGSKGRELLFDYCRYVRDDALDLFQANYLPELLALQIDTEVAAYGGQAP